MGRRGVEVLCRKRRDKGEVAAPRTTQPRGRYGVDMNWLGEGGGAGREMLLHELDEAAPDEAGRDEVAHDEAAAKLLFVFINI
jgi:hypothetical protein